MFHSKKSELEWNEHEKQCYDSKATGGERLSAYRDDNQLQSDDGEGNIEGEALLQFQGMEDSQQQSPTIGDWQKWQLDSATKLSQLQVVWDVFKGLQIVGDSVDLHSLLESLQSSWKQQQQPLHSRITIGIQTAYGSYMIEMEVRTYSLKSIINI